MMRIGRPPNWAAFLFHSLKCLIRARSFTTINAIVFATGFLNTAPGSGDRSIWQGAVDLH